MGSPGKQLTTAKIFAGSLTIVVLSGHMVAYPAAVRDIVNPGFINGIALRYPVTYSLLAPIFQIADRISILSETQLLILIGYINAAWLAWRTFRCLKRVFSPAVLLHESIRFVGLNAAVLLFIFLIILVPRPEASLAVTDPDIMVLDFHTHTKYSWDGRNSATPSSQMEKLTEEGFNAFFITDHNNRLGARKAWEILKKQHYSQGAIPLLGEEISARPANIVVLGPTTKHLERILKKTGISPKMTKAYGVALENRGEPDTFIYATSLTRWWENREALRSLVSAGLDGIEVAKASPKGLNLTMEERKRMVDFASRNGLVMLGSSDDHGFGYTGYVWNLIRLPGWRALDPPALERTLIRRLRRQGPEALTIVTRIKAEPTKNMFLMSLDPLRQIWEMMRSLPGSQAAVFVAYAWMPFLVIILWRNMAFQTRLVKKSLANAAHILKGQRPHAVKLPFDS